MRSGSRALLIMRSVKSRRSSSSITLPPHFVHLCQVLRGRLRQPAMLETPSQRLSDGPPEDHGPDDAEHDETWHGELHAHLHAHGREAQKMPARPRMVPAMRYFVSILP